MDLWALLDQVALVHQVLRILPEDLMALLDLKGLMGQETRVAL